MKTSDCISIIQNVVNSGDEFVLYRFPEESTPRLILGTALAVHDLSLGFSDNTLTSGFLFHPFCPNRTCPTLLLTVEKACRGWELIQEYTEGLSHKRVTLCQIEHHLQRVVPHGTDFRRIYRIFRNQIDRGIFTSLFLSQAIEGDWAENNNEGMLFVKMCEEYPSDFVYIIYTRIGGRWMGHTPRIVLRGGRTRWETISPSGMRHITYTHDGIQLIKDTLQIPKEEVAGHPSSLARDFIRLHEGYPRLYYTGILGPLNLYGETAMFLNLSCLKQQPNGRAIFYGGTMLK